MKVIVFLLFFVFVIPGAFPCGKKEKSNAQPVSAETVSTEGQGTKNLIKIIGRVQIYGSEPHTFVGIVDERENEYAVYPPEKENELRRLQGHLIEFTVVFLEKPQAYGSLFLKGGTVTPVTWEIIR